jgi:hypothetical protein
MSTSDKRRMMTWDKVNDDRKAQKRKPARPKMRCWAYEEEKAALYDDDNAQPLSPRRPGSKVGLGQVTEGSNSSSNADVSDARGRGADDDGDDDDVVDDAYVYLSDSSGSSSEASEVDSDIND